MSTSAQQRAAVERIDARTATRATPNDAPLSDPPQADRVPGDSRGPQGAQRPRTAAEAPSDPPQAERVPGGSRGPEGAQRPRTAAEALEREAARLASLARRLSLRSRREAAGFLAGAWRAAFRGAGFEFEESRPYVPGDDVRSIDWNATARSGELFVKRFREERDQTLLLLVDVSASMGFTTAAGSKAALAARTAALLCAAATQARDRVGLLLFDQDVRSELAPARGEAHAFRVLRAALESARESRGGTGLVAALTRAGPRGLGRRRGVVVLLSDLRDDALLTPGTQVFGALAATAARHDVVSIVLHDPHEDALQDVGRLRVRDPERPDRTLLVRSSDDGVRERYARAAAARRRALERRLRSAGSDVLWLRTDRDPLHALRTFFALRAPGARGATRCERTARP